MKTNQKYTGTLAVLCFLLFSLTARAGNYTWNGSVSSSFSNSSNWSPAGSPNSGDSILITSGANNCVLSANQAVYKLSVSSDTIDLSGNTLTVNNVTISGGFVSGGNLTVYGSSGTSTFSGGTISSVLHVTNSSILFSGTTFQGSVTAIKTGSGSASGVGGCTFSSQVNLIDSSSGTWVFASTNSDTWSEKVTVTQASSGNIFFCHNSSGNIFSKSLTFTNTSASGGAIYSCYYGNALMNDSLILNSAGTKGIFFGTGGGTTTIDTAVLAVGSLGLSSSGTLQLENVRQQDETKAISITATGTFSIVFGRDNILDGDWTVSSPILKLDGTRFNGKASLTHTGSNTNSSFGGNIFADSTLIIHDNATGGNFYTGTANADAFSAPVTIRNNQKGKIGVVNATFMDKAKFENYSVSATAVGGVGSGTPGQTFLVADAGMCTFQDTLTLDNDTAATSFGTSGGSVVFEEDAALNVLTTYYGDLILSSISQNNESEFNIDFSNNPGILSLDTANLFLGPFTCQVQRIRLYYNTFYNTFTLTRTSSYSDTCKGGNYFKQPVVITDTNSAAVNLILAYNYPDVFTKSVTFRQFGSGQIFPCHTKNSSFKGDIITDGTSAINFGYSGGRAIIEGDAEHIFSKLGSYQPTLKKLEINKDAGSFTLTMPISVTDSVFFTKGFLVTDSANLLKIPDNGVVTGASDSSFVIGSVKKIGNDSFTYPLGSLDGEGTGFYHPLTINAPSSATDAFTARYLYQNHNLGLVTDTTIENPSLCEHWKLLRDTGTSNVTVKLGWNTNSCNVFGLDSMHVAVWDTASDKWLDKGNNGTTGTISVGTVVSDSALSIFGVMTLADKFCTSLRTVMAATDVTCPGNTDGTARVIAQGATPPYSYSWNPRPGASALIWDINAGEYFINITDSRGCSVLDSIEVNTPDSIHLSFSISNSSCHESIGTAKVIAEGGAGEFIYFWDNNGESADSIGGLPAGIYSVTVTDLTGCSLDSTIAIGDSDGTEILIDSILNVDCFGNNTGYVQLLYSDSSTVTSDRLQNPCTYADPTHLSGGQFQFLVEDDDGCFTDVLVSIEEPAPLEISIQSSKSTCGDSTGSATVFASGGSGSYSYLWSSGGESDTELGIPSGTDTVWVTDENGCISHSVVIISDTNSFELSVTKTDNFCADSANGSASLNITGGTPPFNYLWLPTLDTSSSINDLYLGNYSVIVTDSNGCLSNSEFSISQPERLVLNVSITPPSSYVSSNGIINVSAKGGTPEYDYLWSSGSTTSQIINAGIGYDTITVTDANNCLARFNVSIRPTHLDLIFV